MARLLLGEVPRPTRALRHSVRPHPHQRGAVGVHQVREGGDDQRVGAGTLADHVLVQALVDAHLIKFLKI